MRRAPTMIQILASSLVGLSTVAMVAPTTMAQEPNGQLDPVEGATYYERMRSLRLADGDPNGIVFTVRGKVVSPDGKPVGNAIVVLRESSTYRISSSNVSQPITSTRPWVVNDVFARTTTDANGVYAFEKVSAPPVVERYQKTWDWDVVAAAPNGQVGWSQLKRGYTVPESVELQRDIVLRETNLISGTLLSAHGQPIVGAFVRSTSLSQLNVSSGLFPSVNTLNLNASSLQLSVRTDANGKFTFPAIPRGLVASVFFRNPDHSFISMRITSAEVFAALDPAALAEAEKNTSYGKIVASPATIKAAPRRIIRGVLRDELGSPLPGQKIWMGSFTSYAETDGQGHFEWPISDPSLQMQSDSNGDGPKTTRFYARELGGNFISLVHVEPLENILESKLVQLTAKRGVEVSGRVVSKGQKQPIANVRVFVTPANDADPLKVVSAVTDNNGAYRVVAPQVPATVRISGTVRGFVLPNGRNPLDEAKSGEFSQVIDLRRKESVRVPPFEVERAMGMEIRVIDDQANPIEAANVTAFYLTSRKPPSTYRSHRELSPPATTDHQGLCSIYPKIQEWEDGVVRAEGRVDGERWFGSESLPTNSDKLITIKLKKPWRIFGRVLLDGSPTVGTQVTLTRRVDDRSRAMSRTMQHLEATTTNTNGEFEFIAPANEEYGASVRQPPGGAARSRRAYFPEIVGEGQLQFPDMEYLSPPGTNGQPKIKLGSIRGSVLNVEGRPISGAQVRLMQYADSAYYRTIRDQYPVASVTTDAKGQFQLTGMPPGQVYLSIYPSRDESETKFIATISKCTVGENGVSIVVDPGLIRELPRIAPVRVIPTDDAR